MQWVTQGRVRCVLPDVEDPVVKQLLDGVDIEEIGALVDIDTSKLNRSTDLTGEVGREHRSDGLEVSLHDRLGGGGSRWGKRHAHAEGFSSADGGGRLEILSVVNHQPPGVDEGPMIGQPGQLIVVEEFAVFVLLLDHRAESAPVGLILDGRERLSDEPDVIDALRRDEPKRISQDTAGRHIHHDRQRRALRSVVRDLHQHVQRCGIKLHFGAGQELDVLGKRAVGPIGERPAGLRAARGVLVVGIGLDRKSVV